MNPGPLATALAPLQAALERELSQRAGFLDEACHGDDELRQEVESVLPRDPTAECFLREPALELATQMLAERPGRHW